MTPFAKMLVFLNLLLSMVFTGWAVGIYTSHVDWAPPRTLTGEPVMDGDQPKKGRLDRLKDDITDYVERRDVGEKRWQAATPELLREEKHRQKYQDWYADLMLAAQTGKDRAGNEMKPAVRELIRPLDKDNIPFGDLKMDEVKPVRIVTEVTDGKPSKEEDLQYAEYYQRKYNEAVEELVKQQKELSRLIDEHKKLTEQLVGVPGMSRGLVGERDDQLAYLKNCLDEQHYLKPLRNNNEAERVLLERRNDTLAARLKALRDVAANR